MKQTHEISSPDNSLFRTWRDCLQSKGIKKHCQFLVFGERAVHDTLKRNPALVRNLILNSAHKDPSTPGSASIANLRKLVRDLTEKNLPRFTEVTLAPNLFNELDLFGTKSPILVLSVPQIPMADLSEAPTGLEILCALQDPANLGAMIRTAAAFGASRIVLLKESASPFHPKSIRAASGNVLATPFASGPSIKELPSIAAQNPTDSWVALDMLGKPLPEFKWSRNCRLILGEEGQGVPDAKAFHFISIPMNSDVESLNATVAVSIAMYSYATSKKEIRL